MARCDAQYVALARNESSRAADAREIPRAGDVDDTSRAGDVAVPR
jgi:hypothetical protein